MDLITRLKTADKPIVLYGMGNGADKIIDMLCQEDIKVSGVFASDGFVRQKLFRGMPLMSYTAAKEQFGQMIVLMSFGSQLPDVISNVKRIAAEQELYVPDVPVVGTGFFTKQYATAHRVQLETVYNALATEEDRKVFSSLVNYKLTGDPRYLYESVGTENRLYDLLGLSDDEVYMDCGAFSGDTVSAFLRHCGGYKRITAVEPDARSYKKLTENLKDLNNTECINAPLGACCGSVGFSSMGSRGSKIDPSGNTVEQKSIDSILGEEGASYIKIDVEGAEREVLKGAENTVKRHRPKLLVSCYHRAEDIFAIPLQVLSMVPDYKMHLWHPLYLPPWDAAYIFV